MVECVSFRTGETCSMTPQEFVKKWASTELGEKQIAQAHFLDVCRLDSIKVKPAAADFAPRLAELHRTLDQAVCDAYGWEYAILEDEEEILRRLLALNLERAE